MRRAMLLSGAFHVVVLTALLMGLPSRPADLPSESAISVDIVTEPTPLAKAPASDPPASARLPAPRPSDFGSLSARPSTAIW